MKRGENEEQLNTCIVMERSRTLIITLCVDRFVDPSILRWQVIKIVDSSVHVLK